MSPELALSQQLSGGKIEKNIKAIYPAPHNPQLKCNHVL